MVLVPLVMMLLGGSDAVLPPPTTLLFELSTLRLLTKLESSWEVESSSAMLVMPFMPMAMPMPRVSRPPLLVVFVLVAAGVVVSAISAGASRE